VHDPWGFLPLRCPAAVEHQRLLRPDVAAAGAAVHGLVPPRRFPVPTLRCPASTHAGRVLAAPLAEEVAALLLTVSSSGRLLQLLACE
jgi:hypothetical protein